MSWLSKQSGNKNQWKQTKAKGKMNILKSYAGANEENERTLTAEDSVVSCMWP